MSIYTTPLQFGYFLAWLFAVLFWLRGHKEERLSDTLLGFVMAFLALEVQDYTFGFAGINFLWEELNGFPRSPMLLFAPTVYYYLRSQVNRAFKLNYRHMWHLLPWAITFVFELSLFVMGKHVVQNWQASVYAGWYTSFTNLVLWLSYGVYFYLSLKLYQHYRSWTENRFSDVETVSFIWLRNFIYLIIAGEIFRWIWFIIDYILDLDFYQDWWWNLFTVFIITYVGIRGYAQPQMPKLVFEDLPDDNTEGLPPDYKTDTNPDIIAKQTSDDTQFQMLKQKLEQLMQEEKPYLEPELSLGDLANRLRTNTSVLSAVINTGMGKNFNDYINQHRIEAFKEKVKQPQSKHLTLLAIAFDCGFNSKATFNRAYKKLTGQTPGKNL